VNDNDPKILVIDIETKLIDVRSFGIRDQHIDIQTARDIALGHPLHRHEMDWRAQGHGS
jgi:hypothetical protein